MGLTDWSLLAFLSILWGGSFFFVGIAVRELPPLTIVAMRVALAALALGALLRLLGSPMPSDRQTWAAFFGMGTLNNLIPFCLIVWGQTQIASGLASVLNATTPLFGVVVAHVLTQDERMTGNRLAGVLIGFAGVAAMIGPAALGGLGDRLLPQVAVLGAALSYAFAGIFGRRFKGMGISPMVTATGQVAASALMLVPVALLVDRPWSLPLPTPAAWSAVAGLALLSTALAYVIFFRVLASAGATNLMLVTFLIPVSAILLGSLFLNERLAVRHGIGMALIAAGLAAIDGRLSARLRQHRSASAAKG
ncbi:Putative permease of the drug/metabolite transporter superfamily [Azospirillum lipoferum 4B]|uniref:Permease of the drug/metabolite transporter superfamily n=2 Tax=Azospirillum lipoferum TaxID=193 RepID=G7Z2P4_AZOL4|nr:Putative permease of the drug/metabolite transporter superfamily [Azospirillum lipoferum 4B]